jgi:hypothetical protein
LRFLASWLVWRLGVGEDEGMRRATAEGTAALADQAAFVARKPAREVACTSAS